MSLWLPVASITLGLVLGALAARMLRRVIRAEALKAERRLEADTGANVLLKLCGTAKTDLAGRAGGEFLPQSAAKAWAADWTDLVGDLRAAAAAPVSPNIAERLRAETATLEDPGHFVDSLNSVFVASRLAECSALFDRVEAHPLAQAQRLAIVRDEDSNLVVAGAGSGKTSTMVAKVAYLIERRLATPSEVLVLAFARKAADELKQRLEKLGQPLVDVSTFHALGMSVIAKAQGVKASLTPLAEDKRALSRFVVEQLRALLEDAELRERVVGLFTKHLYEGDPAAECSTPDEFYRREREIGLKSMQWVSRDAAHRTLDDVLVKSLQEVQIGNWLTLQGIEWSYEPKYEHDTRTVEQGQYRPDFYLPGRGIYIEHFGIQRDGKTAPGINQAEYQKGIAWKRSIHRKYGTTLVCSYSYDFTERTFPDQLDAALAAHRVERKPLTSEEYDELLRHKNRGFSPLIGLLTSFLSLFKGACLTIEAARERARTDRDRAFLDVFGRVFRAYQQRLKDDGDIDFNDMISQARSLVDAGKWRSPYRYILVDEFQDISATRLALLQSLRAHVVGARLFAVGDDWQSIFRFAGSDVGLFTGLAEVVGAVSRTDLDKTFRFRQELADVSSKFITENPAQLQKQIAAHPGRLGEAPLRLRFHEGGWPAVEEAITGVLDDIRTRWDGERPASILLLGRYNMAARASARSSALTTERFRGLKRYAEAAGQRLEFMTVHRSKGLEADYVVVIGIGNGAGTFGFPSAIVDDPVLQMALSATDQFPNGEERRLFYVAVTRASHSVYLLAPSNEPSAFVQELLKPEYRRFVASSGERSERHVCPTCCGITIRLADGQYGEWWACANFPACKRRLATCPSCSPGSLAARDTWPDSDFQCTDCKHVFRRCPRCGVGALVPRTGRHGAFTGCTEYRSTHDGCKYTSQRG